MEDGGLRLLSRLEQGDVHLALVVPSDRFRSRLLYPVHNLGVLSNKHPLSRRRVLDVADLASEPLLLLHRTFGSREWFDAACHVAHIRPRVLLESAAPHALIALTEIGYGVAVVPSTAMIPDEGVRAVALVQHQASIGRSVAVAWAPQRSLPAYAEQFADELAVECRRDYPGRHLIRRAPPLPPAKAVMVTAADQMLERAGAGDGVAAPPHPALGAARDAGRLVPRPRVGCRRVRGRDARVHRAPPR